MRSRYGGEKGGLVSVKLTLQRIQNGLQVNDRDSALRPAKIW